MILGANAFDDAVRAWTIAHQTVALRRAAAFVSKIGAVSVLCWFAIAAAAYFAIRRRWRAAASLFVAPALAVAVYESGKRVFLRARPPNFGFADRADSFPSAHSTTSAAVCCTLAYACWREGLVSRPTAVALAIVPPLLIGLSRVYLIVHWATDVLAGWTTGLLIATVAAVVYKQRPSLPT